MITTNHNYSRQLDCVCSRRGVWLQWRTQAGDVGVVSTAMDASHHYKVSVMTVELFLLLPTSGSVETSAVCVCVCVWIITVEQNDL